MNIAINLIGGVGLLLYGVSVMSDGLKKAAGNRIKKVIRFLTINKVVGVLVGAGVTALIQSSTATTVMVVGLVNAGIMNLFQAIGVIMGAHIGTTITAQLVSFNLSAIAPVAIGVGAILNLFVTNKKLKLIAQIIVGFGVMFTGMDFMKNAVEPLTKYKAFSDVLLNFGRYPILGILSGFALTAMIHSSSAAIGLLIALASQGLLPLSAALPILYGDNIGTCVTSLISSIGASRNARRAALMHMLCNIIGTIIFIFVLTKPIVMIVQHFDPNNISRQIANSHTLFNVINVCILLPFSKYIVKLSTIIVPFRENETETSEINRTKYLDERMFETPSIALENTLKEIIRMGKKSTNTLKFSYSALTNKNENDLQRAFESEKTVNDLQRDLLNYLVKLSNAAVNDDERIIIDSLFNCVNDLERISDHADNIAELSYDLIQKGVTFSQLAKSEIENIYRTTLNNVEIVTTALSDMDCKLANDVLINENKVNHLESMYRKTHITRLNEGKCTIDAGVIYLDILTNVERISDHCKNIAQMILKLEKNF